MLISLAVQCVLGVATAIGLFAIGKVLWGKVFGAKSKIIAKQQEYVEAKRDAQCLSIALRTYGLRRLPEVLEEFTIGDIHDLLKELRNFAAIVRSGNDVIVQELDATFVRVLGVKLNSPEGRKMLKGKLEEAEKVAIEAVKIAVPIIATAAIAAL